MEDKEEREAQEIGTSRASWHAWRKEGERMVFNMKRGKVRNMDVGGRTCGCMDPRRVERWPINEEEGSRRC